MTTLTGYIVNPALYQSVGIEAQAGDQVELFLDQTIADPDLPISIIGTIQPGMTRTCAGTSYDIEYDETDLDESGVDLLTPDMVLSAEIVSEAQVLFGIEEAAREAADLALQDQLDGATSTGTDDLLNEPFLVRWSETGGLQGTSFNCVLGGNTISLTGSGIVSSGPLALGHTVAITPTTSLDSSVLTTIPLIAGTVAVVATYADDTAAAGGGLAVGDIYFTGTKFRARTV